MDPSDTSDEGDLSNIPTRPMRIKILYTFDAESKTTCLARFPDTRNIPAVSIDEQSQVGIIDLQACIQAVVSASPEILSKMDDGDFAVYAFDYSEYDTPLLGQGRLSTLLATPSSHAATIPKITGRVCKNVPALFSNGVKETLEVKLRLTPVRKPTHQELSKAVDVPRSISPAMSAGFDPNAWDASVNQTKSGHQSTDYFDFNAISTNDTASLEEIFGLSTGSSADVSGLQSAGGVGVPETPTEPAFGYNPAFAAQSHSAPGSRAGSPIMGSDSSTRNDLLRHQSFSALSTNITEQSRPDSRASVRSEYSSRRHQRQASTQSQHQQALPPQTETLYGEDGRPYKRAKVVPADWRGKSSFGSKSSDLRINAATASSLHMHRPIPRRPTAPGSNLEPPPRVPTPVPQRTGLPRQRLQASTGHRSMLREASTVDSDNFSEADPMSDAIMSSPEGSSPGDSIVGAGTPVDIPSSPPIYPDLSQNEPSSPGLPTVPQSRFADSGYMSERGFNSSNAVMSMEDDEYRSPDPEDMEMTSKSQSRSRRHQQQPFVKREESVVDGISPFYREESTFHFEAPGDMGQLPSKMLLNLPPHRREASEGHRPRSVAPSSRRSTIPNISAAFTAEEQSLHSDVLETDPQSPALVPQTMWKSEDPQSRRNSLALPPSQGFYQGSAMPPNPNRQSFRRSNTSNDSEAGSPAPSDTEGRPKDLGRSGSGAPRRKIIEQRLQDSLARGEMPQFCAHCGAIETPTWRKLYIKEVVGKPGPLDYVEGEGETIGIQELERDQATGEVTKFLIRKSMKKMKDMHPGKDFKDVFVCNPCGLWFTKFKKMRPSDKWHRKPSTRRKRQKDEDFQSTDALEPQSDAFFTDQIAPEDAVDESSSADDGHVDAVGTLETALPYVKRPRANSMEMQTRCTSNDSDTSRLEHDARAIQSSPVQPQGSQDTPIELDLTPQPTRRLLFPSPRQDGEIKSLDAQPFPRESAPSVHAHSKSQSPCDKDAPPQQTDFTVLKAYPFDKENMIPPLDSADDFSHLFNGSPGALFKTPLPKTPSKTPRSQRQVSQNFETPTRSSRKRKALSDNPNLATANEFTTTPSSSRYFFRSTPSRLERTPGGRSNHSGSDASPFSRHLAQMLNDANVAGPMPFTSPTQQYDFTDLPTFATPGREVDWKGIDDMLSSEFASFEEAGTQEG